MQKQDAIQSLKILGWLLLALLIVGIIIAAAKRKDIERTKSVSVQIAPLPDGEKLITQGDVFELINKSFGVALEGMRHSEVNVERIERILKNYPFVLDADAFIDAQNTVQINIAQRIPILRIMDKIGANYYLDEFGKKLPLSKNYTARVLMATGNIPPFVPDFEEREQHTLHNVYALAKKIVADPFLWAMTEQIHVTNKNEFVLIPKLGKQKILLGKYEQIDNKLENLVIFYQQAIAEKGWQLYENIDLRYKGQVVGVK